MLVKILDKNKNVIRLYDGLKSACITTKLGIADRSLSFKAPYLEIEDLIVAEGYIETQSDRYVVKEIKKSSDSELAEVFAQLDIEELEGTVFTKFKTDTQQIQAALATALSGTGWTVGTCDVTKRRTLSLTNASILDIINQAVKTYRCEVEFNTKTKKVNIYESMGSDRGVYFTSGLNLQKLDVSTTSYDFFTEIEPYGKDGLTIESVNDGVKYLSDYTYSTKRKRLIWKDERYTVAESLKEDAAAKIADMCVPYTAYAADVRDLASMSSEYSILDYRIGDTITLVDDRTGTRTKQRIVTTKDYPDDPDLNSIEIANTTLTFEEYTQKYDDAVSTVENITSDNGTIDGSTVDQIDAETQVINLNAAVIETAVIGDLETRVLNVTEKANINEANIGTLTGNLAAFEEVTAGRLDVAEGNITNLQATSLTADSAVIQTLEANYANIQTVLSGNVGTGALQTIVLNADNASISTALIRSILANNITVNDLLAGNISTDKFTVGSNDGAFVIDGATQSIYDSDGNIRLQLGQDASGNFTFVLYDETGSGILIDATGIKESAIADGLIKDEKIAANAGIQASKLDINSLFSVINGGAQTIKASKIYFDEEGQSLTAAFTQLTQDTASAEAAANRALEAISGIDTLQSMGVSLSNDAHVVNTDTEGDHGDYSGAYTTVTVYVGDADVTGYSNITATPSSGVTGTWNDTTKTYTVTDMTTDEGYVDFDCLYGNSYLPITTRNGDPLTSRNGKPFTAYAGGLHLTKRFSLAKAKDGQTGLSFKLNTSAPMLTKSSTGTITPPSITYTATYTSGQVVAPYIGVYVIEESLDGSSYQETYRSAAAEASKTYTPSSSDVLFIRCSLYDMTGTTFLDSGSVIILRDTDEMETQIQTTESRLAEYKASQDELSAEFASVRTDYYGTKEGSILLQTPYVVNGDNVTFAAKVYRAAVDVTAEFPPEQFLWYTRTEEGDVYMGQGYSKTCRRSDMGFGGVMICRFYYVEEKAIATRQSVLITDRNANQLIARVS